MQPAYLPWLGYIQRILASDLLIDLDHVVYSKGDMSNRNKVIGKDEPIWLSIPLTRTNTSSLSTPLNQIYVNNKTNWQKKQLSTLSQTYAKSVFKQELLPFFMDFFSKEYTFLHEAVDSSTKFLLEKFNSKTPIIKSSTLNISETKSELILELCKKFDADTYISGPFGRDYLDLKSFSKANIKVLFHDFVPFEYPQTKHGFMPFLSSVDMLFNVGKKEASTRLQENICLSEY